MVLRPLIMNRLNDMTFWVAKFKTSNRLHKKLAVGQTMHQRRNARVSR